MDAKRSPVVGDIFVGGGGVKILSFSWLDETVTAEFLFSAEQVNERRPHTKMLTVSDNCSEQKRIRVSV